MDNAAERMENLSPLKRAILEIRDLRSQLDEVERARTEPIAIVGTGLRFPGGANDAESFWRLLSEGVDAITEVPPERWSLDAYYSADASAPGKMTTRYGAFLPDVDHFEPQFFGISPREATSMDPQQRLLLEVSWEALENAGQSPAKLAGSQTGVFIGLSNSDYLRMVFADESRIDTYASTGSTLSVAAGRISYLLGLHGPAMVIDTACSSSLVAVHLACESLRRGECRLVLVGGANLILTPEANINFSKAGMMALDGRCKTFDARADGYVRGEGVAVIVLKRLSDALAEGDHVLALIRSSAINHDGRSSGLTAPNGPAQEAVIREAVKRAGLEPRDVAYVEAHGTGTSLGDPIEVRALGAALGQGRDPDRPLLIGSVKTNIGHLEAAAGLAGLIKVVLALQYGEIPPHLHFQTPNPHIEWSELPIAVTTRHTPWPNGRRIAGVSSFGFSGTNSHVILEAAAHGDAPPTGIDRPLHLLTLSAKSESALRELANRYVRHLDTPMPNTQFPDACFTANAGRSHFAYRLAVVAESTEQARAKLAAFSSGQSPAGVFKGRAPVADQPQVAFLFTGHGSHYLNMGRQLYETQPTFRAIMDRCEELVRPYLDKPLLSVLYPSAEINDQKSEIQDLTYGQPAMFALEYALAMLWRSWGIEPAAVAGHSLGEYVAACVAGVFSLQDALELVAERGRLMQALPEDGEMVAVFADEVRVAQVIAPHSSQVSIAAINSPETVVISGQSAEVQQVLAALKAQKIRSRRLPISRAAHSPMVEPMLPAIAETSESIAFASPQIEMISTVTGKPIGDEIAQPEYWQRHLRATVRFADAMQSLYAQGYRTFVEIGPTPTLLSLGQRCVSPEGDVQPDDATAFWLPSLREGWPDWQPMLESLAALYTSGVAVDWHAFDRDYVRRKLPLPTYPWERKSYWWNVSRPSQPTRSAWQSVVSASRHQSQQAPLDLSVGDYTAKWSALNRLAAGYIANTLESLGAFALPGERHSADTLLARCKIVPMYRSLMLRWLKLMAAEGQLQSQPDGTFACLQPLRGIEMDALWREARETLDLSFVLEYVERCGGKLADVLTGKASPLETLFPDGSFATAEALYQDWAHARYFNHIVRAAVEAANPLRVVEIGAGTGSTTSAVLPALSREGMTYHFTDVSDLFLDRARKKFKAYPFVRYGLLNVEQDPHAQGFARYTFDVAIAANVLHATRNLSETLQNVLTLLAPEGVLVLFEATQHQPWFDITTGLIEGWQSFGDDLRNDSPLLASRQWEKLLREAGFTDVVAFPEPDSPAEILGEHVIVARASASVTPEAVELAAEPERADQPATPGARPEAASDFLRRLQEALPDERRDLVVDFVRGHVASVLRLDPADPFDRKSRLMDLGVDSLMAVELRGRLTKGLGLERNLPATLIFDHPTVEAIADYVLRDVLTFNELPQGAPVERPQAGADIEQLPDEEVEALLLKKLKSLT